MRALLAEYELDSMVDVHTHFMPKQVLDKVWAYFDAAGPLIGRDWDITYRFDEAERLRILRSLGVGAFSSLVYPHQAGMAVWLNEWAAEFGAKTPDCLQSATFFPEPHAARYVTKAIDHGAQVFKAHVQVGDYSPTDPLLDGVWEVLESSGVPTVIHAGSGPAPGRFTGPAGIEHVLKQHPNLKLIIAHMGLPEYEAFLELSERYPYVYLDTTMSFTAFTEAMHPFPPELRPRLAELGHRIMFGSDYPNIPYTYLEAVRAVANLNLGHDWMRRVLRDNALELWPTLLTEKENQ